MKPKEVLSFAKEKGARVVDLRFIDFPGLWQHFTVPIGELSESSFEDGFGFDGSSIRGWQDIHKSDMLAMPQAGALDCFDYLLWLSVIRYWDFNFGRTHGYISLGRHGKSELTAWQ